MATTSEVRWGAYDAFVADTSLDVELNSLANAANVLGAAIDFTAAGVDKKQFMDVEVVLASVDLSAQVNPAVYIWLIARTDGTNFEDGGVGVNPARPPDAIIPVRVVNGAQRVFGRMLLTNPDQAKILVGNRCGAAWAASGNTVGYRIYGEEIYTP